ncbi:hypothetical protein [Geomonas subterranea]|uniref:hypothetical protein n=1 Tax=Geomonas subterranea TaxID=2847989 RepID=UPI001CD2D7DF|nr:hypothetical protein [Geomonas fuzhouensis]
MENRGIRSFDLYFDESGNFEESPIVAAASFDRLEAPQHQSQLVGLLAPAGMLTKESAAQALEGIFHDLGRELPEQIHATEFSDHASYQVLVQKTIKAVQARRWQPVRLVNRDRLGFGDKSATYTHLVAELVVRLLSSLSSIGEGKIRLNIIGATVMLKQPGQAELSKLEVNEYRSRIIEYVSMTAVRLGAAHLHRKWEVVDVSLRSGLYHRALQLCDTLSNASYKNFRRCDPETRTLLKTAFGAYDYTLARTDLLEHVDQHCNGSSYALAVQAIAENWQRSHLAPEVQTGLAERLGRVLRALAGQTATARNAQLRQLADWAGQYLELRDINVAEGALWFMQEHVALPLQKLVADPVKADTEWFLARLLVYRLGNHNHRGDLVTSRAICDQLNQSFPSLACRWEYAPLLTEALTYRAVHLNDCGEHDEASEIMGAVDGCYAALTSLMADALPGIFPARVRTRYRGVALGTKVQSEIYAALRDPGRLEEARRLSDEALDEFVTEGDLQRQFQYRCQIEALAGDYASARSWLARGLCSGRDDHDALAQLIKLLHGPQQGFALLHWSRIAMEAGRSGNKTEMDAYAAAFERAGLTTSPWLVALGQAFPAHAIRRHMAVFNSHLRRSRQGIVTLRGMRQLASAGRPPLLLMQLAAIAEVAAACCSELPEETRRLLNGHGKDKGVYLLAGEFTTSVEAFPRLREIAGRISAACQAFEKTGCRDAGGIAAACRLVP